MIEYMKEFVQERAYRLEIISAYFGGDAYYLQSISAMHPDQFTTVTHVYDTGILP